ncbi:MAG: response regulator transcription factor [Chloroflexota bacterium]|nr:response regulator transcription factor [Chloroflexota bacterium]
MAENPGPPEADPRARLLVVDDDPNTRAGLRDLLGLLGYHVEQAGSGYEALKLLESETYDLVILDMRMPGMDGIEVMRRARQMRPDLLIVVLTAHATLESAIAAVKSDAVDYLLKPINVEGLAATISQALQGRAEQLHRQYLLDVVGQAMDTLRQTESPVAPVSSPLVSSDPALTPLGRFLERGPLRLDRHKRLAMMKGDPMRTVELTEGEAAILIALMEYPNQVLSCGQLARAAMGYDLDKWAAQSLVRPCIHRLRRKLEATPDKPRLIRTVRGRGYFFSLI